MSDIYRTIGAQMFGVPEDEVSEEMRRQVKSAAYRTGWALARRDRIEALKKQIKAQEQRVLDANGYHARSSARHYLTALYRELIKLEREEEPNGTTIQA